MCFIIAPVLALVTLFAGIHWRRTDFVPDILIWFCVFPAWFIFVLLTLTGNLVIFEPAGKIAAALLFELASIPFWYHLYKGKISGDRQLISVGIAGNIIFALVAIGFLLMSFS